MDECPCRVCAGDPCLCKLGDHCGRGPNCSCCGYVNYCWLGYLGAVGRWAKVWGVSKEEAGRRIENHQRAHDGIPPEGELANA